MHLMWISWHPSARCWHTWLFWTAVFSPVSTHSYELRHMAKHALAGRLPLYGPIRLLHSTRALALFSFPLSSLQSHFHSTSLISPHYLHWQWRPPLRPMKRSSLAWMNEWQPKALQRESGKDFEPHREAAALPEISDNLSNRLRDISPWHGSGETLCPNYLLTLQKMLL